MGRAYRGLKRLGRGGLSGTGGNPSPLQGRGARLGSLLPSRSGEGLDSEDSAPRPLSTSPNRPSDAKASYLSPKGERGLKNHPNFPSTATPENPQETVQVHSEFDPISVGNKSNRIPRTVTLKSHLKRCSGELRLPNFCFSWLDAHTAIGRSAMSGLGLTDEILHCKGCNSPRQCLV